MDDGIPRKIRRVMRLLRDASRYVEQAHADNWDFAVEIGDLLDAGANKSDLRWLLSQGFIRSAQETTPEGATKRQFEGWNSVRFDDATCFVATPDGLTFYEKHRGDVVRPAKTVAVLRPVWDCDRRELRVSGKLVKLFRRPSCNQERILQIFQEDGWPFRIDDPLPPKKDQDSKRRLRETIRGLNCHQENRLIRFSGDGTGEGVCWQLSEPAESVGGVGDKPSNGR